MKNLIKNIVRWARITKAGSDDQQFATQQMEYLGKVADGIIVFPYGIHGNVPPDSLALMFAAQGNPDNRAAIAWTPKDRPKLAEGEVAFYHPPTGAFIIWRASGDLDIETGNKGGANINIKCNQANITAAESVTVDTVDATIKASSTVTVDSPESTFTGNVTIDMDLDVTGATTLSSTVTSTGKDISDTHTHTGSATAPSGPQVNTGAVA